MVDDVGDDATVAAASTPPGVNPRRNDGPTEAAMDSRVGDGSGHLAGHRLSGTKGRDKRVNRASSPVLLFSSSVRSSLLPLPLTN